MAAAAPQIDNYSGLILRFTSVPGYRWLKFGLASMQPASSLNDSAHLSKGYALQLRSHWERRSLMSYAVRLAMLFLFSFSGYLKMPRLPT